MSRSFRGFRSTLALGATSLLLTTAAPAFAEDTTTQTTTTTKQEKPHSMLKGAAVGGVGGAVIGGKKGAVVGAGAGALIQHHRNKKAEKAAEKAGQQ